VTGVQTCALPIYTLPGAVEYPGVPFKHEELDGVIVTTGQGKGLPKQSFNFKLKAGESQHA
jgi:hypothetical protein